MTRMNVELEAVVLHHEEGATDVNTRTRTEANQYTSIQNNSRIDTEDLAHPLKIESTMKHTF